MVEVAKEDRSIEDEASGTSQEKKKVEGDESPSLVFFEPVCLFRIPRTPRVFRRYSREPMAAHIHSRTPNLKTEPSY